MCVCRNLSSVSPKSNTLEPDWPQNDHPVAYVIAQQCSSATYLHFHCRKEKFGVRFRYVIMSFSFYFFLQLRIPESA
jgi:hypothetical protein